MATIGWHYNKPSCIFLYCSVMVLKVILQNVVYRGHSNRYTAVSQEPSTLQSSSSCMVYLTYILNI